MKSLAFALAFACLSLSACSNSKYCDAETPCESSATPFCDVNGTFSQIRNNCIATPNMMMPDASVRCDMASDCTDPAAPACKVATGLCVECIDVSTCPSAAEPTCNTSTNMCSGCTADADCTARTDGLTQCNTSSGVCVACNGNEDCTPSSPICDTTSSTCRACAADSECTASGVCNTLDADPDNGKCVAEGDVAYVNKDALAANVACTRALKCNTITKAILVTGTPAARKWILVDPSAVSFSEPTIALNNKLLVIKGPGAKLSSSGDNTAALLITGTSNVTLVGLEVTAPLGNDGDTDADAIRCTDGVATPVLVLRSAKLTGSKSQGLDVNRCNVNIAGSTLSGNAGGGVSATNSTLTLTGSTLSGNAGGGVSLSASNFSLVNNFFLGNGSDTAPISVFGALSIVHAGTPTTKRLEFNTFVGNKAADNKPAAVLCDLTNTTLAAKHVIADQNTRDGTSGPTTGSQVSLGGGCTWAFSLVTDTAFPLAGGNLNAPAPTFPGIGTGDLHLGVGSSGVNVGDTAGTDITTDIDGQPRVSGGRVDMGADEVQ